MVSVVLDASPLFPTCPVFGSKNLVGDPREVCGECRTIFGDYLQTATGPAPNTEAFAVTIGQGDRRAQETTSARGGRTQTAVSRFTARCVYTASLFTDEISAAKLRRQTRWLPDHRCVVSLMPAKYTRRARQALNGDLPPFIDTVHDVEWIGDMRHRLTEIATSDSAGQGGTP